MVKDNNNNMTLIRYSIPFLVNDVRDLIPCVLKKLLTIK